MKIIAASITSIFSYLSRGIYLDQLLAWENLFAREQMMTLISEDFYNDPANVFKQVQQFLGLPNWVLNGYIKFNAVSYSEMQASTRKRLLEYFKPHNIRLSEYLDINLGWDN